MKILLDCSPARLAELTAKHDYEFWQLRTPLTQYARAAGVPWALDNGCFASFDRARWERMLEEADADRPLFVTLPDIVGDAQRTSELFEFFHRRTQELPRALVLQDGIEHVRIPWSEISAVFIGGSDAFKYSPVAFAAAKTARMLGRWVHVGRVNTPARVRAWLGSADSLDGSGISRYDHMLEDVLAAIRGQHPSFQQGALDLP